MSFALLVGVGSIVGVFALAIWLIQLAPDA